MKLFVILRLAPVVCISCALSRSSEFFSYLVYLWMSLPNVVSIFLVSVVSSGLDQASLLSHLFRFIVLLTLLFATPLLVPTSFPQFELYYLLGGGERVFIRLYYFCICSYPMPQNPNIFPRFTPTSGHRQDRPAAVANLWARRRSFAGPWFRGGSRIAHFTRQQR